MNLSYNVYNFNIIATRAITSIASISSNDGRVSGDMNEIDLEMMTAYNVRLTGNSIIVFNVSAELLMQMHLLKQSSKVACKIFTRLDADAGVVVSFCFSFLTVDADTGATFRLTSIDDADFNISFSNRAAMRAERRSTGAVEFMLMTITMTTITMTTTMYRKLVSFFVADFVLLALHLHSSFLLSFQKKKLPRFVSFMQSFLSQQLHKIL